MSRRSYESSVILLSVFLYFLITLPVCAKAQKVSCEIAWAKPMSETTLTCHFPEDVSQTKKDITVYHYDKDLNVFPDTVLECLWIAGKMMCLTHPGYEFNNNVTDHLIVRIPQVSENYTGRYSCQMSGTRVQDIDFCRFDLNRVKGLDTRMAAGEPISTIVTD